MHDESAPYNSLDIEAIPSGLVVADRDGCIIKSNAVARQIILGSSGSSFSRKFPDAGWKVYAPGGHEIDASFLPWVQSARNGRHFHQYLLGLEHPGRGRIWLGIDATPLPDSGAIATIVDVTDHFDAARTIRKEKEIAGILARTNDIPVMLGQVLDIMLSIDGIDCGGVYLVDPGNGELELKASAGLSEKFRSATIRYAHDSPNYSLAKAGKPLFYDSEDLAGFGMDHPVVKEGLTSVGIFPILHEGEIVAVFNLGSRKDRTFNGYVRSVIEGVGIQLGSAIMRIRAEMESAIHMRNLQVLLESMDDFVYVVDEYGSIVFQNRAAREGLGYSDEEARGKKIVSLHPYERQEDAATAFARMLTGEERVCHIPLVTKAGSLIPVETRVTLATWDGKPAVIGISRDISEQIESERKIAELNSDLERKVVERTAQLEGANLELETRNKELDSFAYSVSHDLRAPLRAMEGFSHRILLKHSSSLDPESLHHLKRIQVASERMGRLINDLLGLSRISRQSLRFSEVDMSALAVSALARHSRLDPSRDACFSVDEGLKVRGDQHLLAVLVEHLIDNAWKFSDKTRQLFIHFGKVDPASEERVQIFFVEDNGEGFDMAYSDQLFKPFTKLGGIEGSEGTGIGLVMAKRVAERHGGTIWMESKPGAGTKVFFTLA